MSSVNLNPNGFLVKRIDSEAAKIFGQYRGVEGDCFPINECFLPKKISLEESKYLSNFLKDNVMLNDSDNSYVDVCPNIYFLKRYIKACLAEGLEIQVIYCKTQKNSLKVTLIRATVIINLWVTIMAIPAVIIILVYSMM